MLHIIFLIMKIIGVILLVILGLIVLLLCVLLFSGVKYEGEGSCKGTLQSLAMDLKFHWIFHLVRGRVIYQDETLFYQVKVAWKSLATSEDATEATTEEATTEGATTEETIVEETTVEETTVEETTVEETIAEEAVSGDTAEEGILTEEMEMMPENETVVTTHSISNAGEEHPHETLKDRISSFFDRIKYTFQKICDKIKKLIETKDRFVDFLTDETHKNAWGRGVKEIKRILHRLNPKRLELDLRFGFDDPSLTGKILAFCGMLYPLIVHHVQLRPDFEQQIIEGEGRIKGCVRAIYFVSAALHLLLDRNVRMTYKDIKNLR